MGEPAEGHWEHERYCSAVAAEIARLAEAVDGADPATPVPSCPGWTIATLLKHVGTVHRWAEHIVRHRAEARVSQRDVTLDLPVAESGYPAWLASGAGPLVATLRAADPDSPIWAWGPDHRAHWWSRRMLHETTVHRADAEIAVGRTPHIEQDVAVDGIGEFLTNLPFLRGAGERLANLGGNGETVHLHATDSDGEWMIILGADGFSWEPGHGKGTVAVRGPSSDLLLLTYGRLRPADGRFEIFGAAGLLDRWRDLSVF
jgi:uncharacterized protein (TIGR03083 family)